MNNKLASVVYAYSPKNDDELELAVGDKIEVIGYEEEGWWKGRLKGRIGVFPSNFVEVVEVADSVTSSTQQQVTNKLSSIFGSKVTSKNSISSNSLNTLNNNAGTNSLNNNNSNSNNNLIMNNTQNEIDSTNNEYPFATAEESHNSSASSNEKRPRPIRGNGFGDIFAAGAKPVLKPLPADPNRPPTAMASERLSTMANNLTNTLQKPIPKKPPPPAPANDTISNGSLADQAPALPPKPSSQLSPFLQQTSSSRSLPSATHSQTSIAQVREQVRVIYAYKSSIPDELTIEVGDIINVIDKNIEDQGWWKGELNGKIGVFPDNFVKPLTAPDLSANNSTSQQQDWNGSRTSNSSQQSSLGFTQQQQHTTTATTTESKIKSVFAATPKGFSKELENNLEKHGNPAMFLSLKRKKMQQQEANSISVDNDMTQAKPSEMMGAKREQSENSGSQESSPTKLNHITANRAKGPSRRPPSSILNKRNQSTNEYKRESNGRVDETAPCSLPANSVGQQQLTNHEIMSSLPFGPNKSATAGGLVTHDTAIASPHSKSNLSLNTDGEAHTQVVGSRQSANTSSRYNPAPPTQQPITKSITTATTANNTPATTTTTTTSSPPSRPPWMVELRKSNLEKKRDTTALNHDDETPNPVLGAINSRAVDSQVTATGNNLPHNESLKASSPERKSSIQSLKESLNQLPVSSVKSITSRYTAGDLGAPANQQSIGLETPNRASLLSGNSNFLPTQDASSAHQQELSHSPVANRLNSLLGKGKSPQSKGVASLSTGNSNENENIINNNPNVPLNDNKYMGSPSSISTVTPPASTNQSNSIDTNNHSVAVAPATGIHDRSPQSIPSKSIATKATSGRQSLTDSDETKFVMSKVQYDNLVKQISNNVNTEISELRNEIKKLHDELKGVHELKAVVETMKRELTACQSATENQKRYIRELVTNLADERKKIAAMQGELEKNFK